MLAHTWALGSSTEYLESADDGVTEVDVGRVALALLEDILSVGDAAGMWSASPLIHIVGSVVGWKPFSYEAVAPPSLGYFLSHS